MDLTGTGIVGRAVTCSGSVRAAMAGAGELPESCMEIGVVTSTRGLRAGSLSGDVADDQEWDADWVQGSPGSEALHVTP